MPDNDNITIPTPPPEVQAILDEADMDGPFGASFTENSVQLIAKDKTVVKEVEWEFAGEFARNLVRNIMETRKS